MVVEILGRSTPPPGPARSAGHHAKTDYAPTLTFQADRGPGGRQPTPGPEPENTRRFEYQRFTQLLTGHRLSDYPQVRTMQPDARGALSVI